MPLFEGDYTPRLKYLAELPPGKVAAHFDRIDRKKFKEVCGDTMCFWGNVPSSLLVTGTPQQVKDDVKELVDLFGETGLILDGAGRHPRPGQAGERRGARRGRRGVRRALRPALTGFVPNIYRYCGMSSHPAGAASRNHTRGRQHEVSYHSRWTRLAVVLAACALVVHGARARGLRLEE